MLANRKLHRNQWTPTRPQGHRHTFIIQCFVLSTTNRTIRRLYRRANIFQPIFKAVDWGKSRISVNHLRTDILCPFFMVSYIVSSASNFNARSQNPNTHPFRIPSQAYQTIGRNYTVLRFNLHEVRLYLRLLGMRLTEKSQFFCNCFARPVTHSPNLTLSNGS